jgi:rare lipoprotein A
MTMPYSRYFLIAAMALLTACSTSHRPVYSGHEESTAGVPGFANGKKMSPHVKLGQSYTVDGETYVPRHQPDYVEVGMASWYGPGFHGGKTANGEEFDSAGLTAAHRTLPLPSIVRVTMVSTGKQVYVRVNDRGPFAHSRIIDLSRGAAEKIGLVRTGVGKVRVEYMAKESQRFAELLAQGRSPKSIDLASEVIDYNSGSSNELARGDVRLDAAEEPSQVAQNNTDARSESFWDNFGNAPAQSSPSESTSVTNKAAPIADVASSDLAAPKQVVSVKSKASMPSKPKEVAAVESPFSVLESAAGPQSGETQVVALTPSPPLVSQVQKSATEVWNDKLYVQLGAFQNQANADRLRDKYTVIPELQVVKKVNATGQTLYHVRMGPYTTSEASNAARDRLTNAGADAKIVKE